MIHLASNGWINVITLPFALFRTAKVNSDCVDSAKFILKHLHLLLLLLIPTTNLKHSAHSN